MQKQRQMQPNSFKPTMQSQTINPIEEDTKLISNIDCSTELLQFSRPMQPPKYSDQYVKRISQQKSKESISPPSQHHSNKKPQNKAESCSERNSSLLISTSQDKILSPKTNYNFMQRSNSQKKATENNKSHIDNNCSEINYTNYNSNNTTCIYSSAERYWQKRELNHKMKMDKIRNDNYQKEQNEMRDRPVISKNSQKIATHLRSKSKEQVFDRLSSGVDVRKRIEDIKQIEYQNSQNRKPMINQSSHRLQRTIDDLYQWKVQIERKKKECQTITNSTFDPTPLINNQSNDILKERKPDYLRKKVEDRLIEQGEITKIKKEERKEHYLERLMIPGKDDKNCYMTTCPSKRVHGNNNNRNPTCSTTTQQGETTNNYQQYDCNTNGNRKYIQKNKSANQSSEMPIDPHPRSLSGRMKYNNDSYYDNNTCNNNQVYAGVGNRNQVKANYTTNTTTSLYQNNITYEHNCNNNGQSNMRKQQHDVSYGNMNLSQDVIPRQNNASKQQSPQGNNNNRAANDNTNNDNNLLEIRKHLNNYYEQKAQKVNKSFSYNNTNNVNVNANNNNQKKGISTNTASVTPVANKTKVQPTITPKTTTATTIGNNKFINTTTKNNNSITNSNSKERQVAQSRYQLNERELEEDHIINQIPKNEPKIQQPQPPVLFQEETSCEPCGENINQPRQYINNSFKQNNYQPRINYNYQSNPQEEYNISYNHLQANEAQQSYYKDRTNNNNNNTQSNDSLIHNSLPPKYNFNQEIFNRFTQEAIQHPSKMLYEPQLPPQKSSYQPQQQQQLHSQIHQGDIHSNPMAMYSRSNDIESQIITQMSNTSQLKEDNPMNKYREETSKRIQDLEQMQLFASNLRQSTGSDMIYGKKIVSNNSSIPQCQYQKSPTMTPTATSIPKQNTAYANPSTNANYNLQADNLTHLNDRLKLNEKSKNYLYEKMTQVSAYPSTIPQQDKQIQNELPKNNATNDNNNNNNEGNRMIYQSQLKTQSPLDVNSFEFQRHKY